MCDFVQCIAMQNLEVPSTAIFSLSAENLNGLGHEWVKACMAWHDKAHT